jgi:hypothetical protein
MRRIELELGSQIAHDRRRTLSSLAANRRTAIEDERNLAAGDPRAQACQGKLLLSASECHFAE